jgi:hypothetical protein
MTISVLLLRIFEKPLNYNVRCVPSGTEKKLLNMDESCEILLSGRCNKEVSF